MTGTSAAASEMICDGGRLLWPVRWNPWRHGTWSYRITAVPEDEGRKPKGESE